jgi:hypothetical protein
MKTTIDGKQYTAVVNDNGTITLKPVVAEAPKPEHRCGDVWVHGDYGFKVTDAHGKFMFTIKNGHLVEVDPPNEDDRFLLNIFDFAAGEYVKKSDVVAALSHEDDSGDSVINGRPGVHVSNYAIDSTRKALAKLGITA